MPSVKRLGLRPTNARRIYLHIATCEHYNVPDPTDMTPEQRADTIEMLKARLGIGTSH
jgi:hypothetical protein